MLRHLLRALVFYTAVIPVLTIAAIQSHGLLLFSLGIVVTLVPLTVATIVAHRILGLNPVIICGALAGAMTVDAAVTGSCERADSQTPVLGVAVPYAVGNVLLTILGPSVARTGEQS